MKWSEMSERDRDALVATAVMGWQPGPCDGEMGEQPCSPDGWFCQKCGHEGAWGDDFEHDEIPPRYTASMDRAWQVAQKFERIAMGRNAPTGKSKELCEVWVYTEVDKWIDGRIQPPTKSYGVANTMPEAICLAALKACDVEIK